MVADLSSPSDFRRTWLRIHKGIGLGLFILLIPLAATGALSALRPTLEAAFHPERSPTTAAPATPPLNAYAQTAQTAFGPGATLIGLTLKPGQAVVASGRMRPLIGRGEHDPPLRLTAWIDPGTARLLSVEQQRGRGDDFMARAHDLHETFMLGAMGRRIVGALGVLMLIEALIGLILWWPAVAALGFGLRWRRIGDPVANLHYLIGFWAAVPLTVLALTGIGLSFPGVMVEAISQVAPVRPLPPPGRTLFASRLNADQAAALALAGETGAHIVSLQEPTDSRPSWKFDVVGGGHGPVRLGVNDDTGAVRTLGERRSSPGNVIQRNIARLHGADGEGRRWAVWRWISIVAGFMPALLALTGLTVLCSRRLRRGATV